MFRVGDRVWTIDNGWGEVIEIKDGITYPVRVEFKKLGISYTKDGREFESKNVMLFFEEIPIPESALVRPRWRAEYGETFYYVGIAGEVSHSHDAHHNVDNMMFESGNYFQTEKEARESKFYKVFHEEVE